MDFTEVELIRFAAQGVLYAWIMVLSIRVAFHRFPRAWRTTGEPGYVSDVLVGVLAAFGVVVSGAFIFNLTGY